LDDVRAKIQLCGGGAQRHCGVLVVVKLIFVVQFLIRSGRADVLQLNAVPLNSQRLSSVERN
jgi:hypothetical protein